ncbi:MAG TPA: Gfo/Idh/MocA family oxidoreductase [Roseiflexaceae bacterium]|nr:Gfo/Idh/MocA family oxidoreductase [Roseiflexaceae bacterium]
MMTIPLRAGLIGCGSLAQRGVLPHLSEADAREHVRLVAVADNDIERAQRTAERYHVPVFFGDIHAMLAGADLDLVIILTPIPLHYEHAMAAIAAGKHVYVQKAMTTTLAEADALLAARDQAGVKLAAAPGYELFPTTAKMREVVASGALGKVAIAYTYTMGFGHEHESIRAGEGALAAIDPSWYFRAGAGPLPDVTVYALQLITSVLGPVRRVTAMANKVVPEREWRGKSISIEVADNNLVMMEFATGTLGVAVGAECRGSPRVPWGGMALFGTHGVLEITEVHNPSGYPTRYAVGREETSVALTEQPYLRGAHLEIEACLCRYYGSGGCNWRGSPATRDRRTGAPCCRVD